VLEDVVAMNTTMRSRSKHSLWDAGKSDITRSLIRIFDAILWFSHPAASVTGAKRSIEVGLEA
jgi:hypothetical protein